MDNQNKQSMMIFDCEIRKAILGRRESPLQGIEYADGWRDFANMGISVICTYDYLEDRYQAFFEDNFSDLQKLISEREVIVNFNGLGFDNPLCEANNIHVPNEKTYDILVKVWEGAGLGPKFVYPTHAGYGLDACCATNFGANKTGFGGFAPVWWQRGEYGKLVSYCLDDVRLTKGLLDKIVRDGCIVCPKTGGRLKINGPFQVKVLDGKED